MKIAKQERLDDMMRTVARRERSWTRQKMASSTEQYLRNDGESGMVLRDLAENSVSKSWRREVSA